MPNIVFEALVAVVAVAALWQALRAPSAPALPQATTRRPILVWVISILYVVAATRSILPLVLGPVSLALKDALFVAANTILEVAGAVLLFMLRRQAFTLLVASWLIGVVQTTYQVKDLVAVIPARELALTFVLQALTLAVLLYIYRLKSWGILR